jgi:hypothetical protein
MFLKEGNIMSANNPLDLQSATPSKTSFEVPNVSLETLEKQGQATHITFEFKDLPANVLPRTKGIGITNEGKVVVLQEGETSIGYPNPDHPHSVPAQDVPASASIKIVDPDKQECITTNGLDGDCATVAEIILPDVSASQKPGVPSTNGVAIAVNVGPVQPSNPFCADTYTPNYPVGTNPSAVSLTAAIVTGAVTLADATTNTFSAPKNTLNHIELPRAELTAVLGKEDPLLVSSTTVYNQIGYPHTTVYINPINDAKTTQGMADDPLCTITGAKLFMQATLSEKINKKAEVIGRDLILARLVAPLNGKVSGQVVIVTDIDARKGATIDLEDHRNLSEQGVYTLDDFHWGDQTTPESQLSGHSVMAVLDQETYSSDPDSTGLDTESSGLDDTDSTGRPSIYQKRVLLVGSAGEYYEKHDPKRPRAYLIDLDTVGTDSLTSVAIVDQSDTADKNDLGRSVAAAGLSNENQVVSEYPLISRPTTKQIFVLDPVKVMEHMDTHAGESSLDITELSALTVTDTQNQCPGFAKNMFTGGEHAPLGVQCDAPEAAIPDRHGVYPNKTSVVIIDPPHKIIASAEKQKPHRQPRSYQQAEQLPAQQDWFKIGAGLSYLSGVALQTGAAALGLTAENSNQNQFPLIENCSNPDTDTDIHSDPSGLSPAAMVGIGVAGLVTVGLGVTYGLHRFGFLSSKKGRGDEEQKLIVNNDDENLDSGPTYGAINP